MSSVSPISSTVQNIRDKARRLAGVPSLSQLSQELLDEYINTAATQDLPADIKSLLLKQVVEVMLVPNQDKYALAGSLFDNETANTYESIREPVYVEGRRAAFYKDRGQFYGTWPITKTYYQLTGGTYGGDILGIDISGDPTIEITVESTEDFQDGDVCTFADVGGTTELNGNSYPIDVTSSTTFTVEQPGASAWTSGGTYSIGVRRFTQSVGFPFLQEQVTVGATVGGGYVTIEDNGQGALVGAGQTAQAGNVAGIDISAAPTLVVTTQLPHGLEESAIVSFSQVAGTTELNGNSYYISNVTNTSFEITQANPTAYTGSGIWRSTASTYGFANYVSGSVVLDFPSAPDPDTQIDIWVYQYSAGWPMAVLFWKDYIVVRPVPNKVYKLTLEAYKYPTQFTSNDETPILKQWWQYIAMLAARKILEDREDMQGVANLEQMIKRQEALVRNRNANEQIGQRNATIYNGSTPLNNFPYQWGNW